MKSRLWGIIPGLIVLLAITIMMDWSGLFDQPGNRTSNISLRACEPALGGISAPLIPELQNESIDVGLSNAETVDLLSLDTRSTRAGFGISSETEPEHWASLLGAGWYLDWKVQANKPLNNLEHWQMIRVHEDCILPSIEDIRQAASQYPGQVWVIGNEPDVIWQDNVPAPKYAMIYHDLYAAIKAYDPTALIAVAGVSQATPLRLQYLDQVLQAYQDLYHASMPADWWTLHGYVLREEQGSWGVDIPPGISASQGQLREVSDHGRIDLFEDQIMTFRQWMADHGYQNTPLALTEFGLLMPSSYGFPASFVSDYLAQTFAWLSDVRDETTGYPGDDYHLIQKWAWFSVSDPTYASSNLGDLTSGKMTRVGESFRETVLSLVP